MKNKRIAIIATDYFEEEELVNPLQHLQASGAAADVIAPHAGEIIGLNHVEPGKSVTVTRTLEDADPKDYDAVIVPGGVVNADHLRMNEHARDFLRIMVNTGKPTAIICHGPWLLVSAGLARGKKLTSYHTLQDDIRNAGGQWVDEPVVVDGNLITSRKPDDLPAFIKAITEALSE